MFAYMCKSDCKYRWKQRRKKTQVKKISWSILCCFLLQNCYQMVKIVRTKQITSLSMTGHDNLESDTPVENDVFKSIRISGLEIGKKNWPATLFGFWQAEQIFACHLSFFWHFIITLDCQILIVACHLAGGRQLFRALIFYENKNVWINKTVICLCLGYWIPWLHHPTMPGSKLDFTKHLYSVIFIFIYFDSYFLIHA